MKNNNIGISPKKRYRSSSTWNPINQTWLVGLAAWRN